MSGITAQGKKSQVLRVSMHWVLHRISTIFTVNEELLLLSITIDTDIGTQIEGEARGTYSLFEELV